MPKCSRCNQSFPNKTDLSLVREENGRWQVLCKACLSGGARSAAPGESHGAAPEPEGAASALSLSPEEKLKAETFEKIRQTLDELNQVKAEEAHTQIRAHERKDADMRVHFCVVRDDEVYQGVVKDISQGGMRFECGVKLEQGQIIKLEVGAPDKSKSTTLLQSTAEVRRVASLGPGQYEIGVRFVKKLVADGENRRRYKRHRVDMAAYYRRAGSGYTTQGRVRDLSQGGCRLVLDENVAEGESFPVVLRGRSEQLSRADICAVAKVVRVKSARAGEWEAGCVFLEMHIRKRE